LEQKEIRNHTTRHVPVLIHKVLTGAQRRIFVWTDGKSETCVRFRFPNLFSLSFSLLPLPTSRMRRFRCLAALTRLDAHQQALVEPIHGIDVALGAWIVSHHHDRFLELPVHIDQQA
jgi:hypothetical protein